MAVVHEPHFAGRFYPREKAACERMLAQMFAERDVPSGPTAIVPHAGWVYSGRTAALGVRAVAAYRPDVVVVFGSVHVATGNEASLIADGVCVTPVGELEIDGELAERIARKDGVVVDAQVHRGEHSIEVQLPLIRWAMPDVRIVPLMVRPGSWAAEVGRASAEAARDLGRRAAFLGSTDLTHYGPAFGFEPAGRGAPGLKWAKEVNDRRLIERIARLDAGGVIEEAALNRNACGAGAVAAAIGAAEVLGATEYRELEHTTSAEVEATQGYEAVNSVGYEAGVFVIPG